MHVLEGQYHAGGVELRMWLLAEEALLVVGGIELATQGQLQQEIEVLGAVVGLVELDLAKETRVLSVISPPNMLLEALNKPRPSGDEWRVTWAKSSLLKRAPGEFDL